jgi:prepilin-type N-terminal cleavage/methylation domain-containing protein
MMKIEIKEKIPRRFIRYTGFTLAEVLITLAIIGFVAAMTIPTLINKINESQWHTAWKKEFSVISQAYKLYLIDNEDVDFGYDVTALNKLSPYLKIASTNPTLPDSNKFLNGSSVIVLSWTNAQLADGSIVYFLNHGWSNCNSASFCVEINIDINGIKAPNTIGKDIYGLWLTKDSVIPMKLSNYTCIQPPNTGWDNLDNYGYGCSEKYLEK